jgi:hypothetical protein
MNQAYILKELDNRLLFAVAEPSINVNPMTISSQLAGEFPDVNAHAAGIIGTQFSDGVGMDAEHCNSNLFYIHFYFPTVAIDASN